MKQTKDFIEFAIVEFIPKIDLMPRRYRFENWFRQLPFEFQEGVYRAYFREKGIHIKMKYSWVDAEFTSGFEKDGELQVIKEYYKTYPEAFEALVNKLFENEII